MKDIIWTTRYSDTDEPDKQGRWARVGYLEHKSRDQFKACQIAWINKIGDQFSTYVYVGKGEFKNSFTDLDEAKEYCKETIIQFYKNYLED